MTPTHLFLIVMILSMLPLTFACSYVHRRYGFWWAVLLYVIAVGSLLYAGILVKGTQHP